MKLYKLICILLLSSCSIWGQESAVNGYKNDLDLLRKTLDESYPSLYRFNDKDAIDRLFKQCQTNIDTNTTVRDFYKTVKYILSAIGDGHLGCSEPDSLRKYFDEREKYFPIMLYFTGKYAYVCCSDNDSLPVRTQVTAINGKKIDHIRKDLFAYIVGDGAIESKKYWILNRTFWFYYNLVYGQQPFYDVTCKGIDGKPFTISVAGKTLNEMTCKGLQSMDNKPLLDLAYPEKGIALLTIRTFSQEDLAGAGLNFEQFLENAFADINGKQTGSLIIDLRGNGGGKDTYGSLLYAYLTDQPFHYYKQLETSKETLSEAGHPNLSIQQPRKNNFKGKVYILINGLSFSAASEFCTIAKEQQRAEFIGEETGGTYCGNTSGSFLEVPLPFSEIRVFVPTTKYTMMTKNNRNRKRGVFPDYPVTPTIGDLIEKNDVQLNRSIEIAGE